MVDTPENEIRIELEGDVALEPGSEVSGSVTWRLAHDPASVHVRLFWYTEGKGDRDLSVVEELAAEAPATVGTLSFRFELPPGPYGFSGKLISLVWALEAVADPMGVASRTELVVAPGGREVRIDAGPDAEDGTGIEPA